jgi:hypothetical protein
MRKSWTPWIGSLLLVITGGVVLAADDTSPLGPDTVINWTTSSRSPDWRNKVGSTYARVHAQDCRDEYNNGTSDWIDARMWRHAGLFPPRDFGAKRLSCYGSTYVYRQWTDSIDLDMTGPEDFHWSLDNYSGGTGSPNAMDFTYKVTWNG